MKYIISIALITLKPVKSPMVPPTADIQSANFILLSFSILSKAGVSKKIRTNCSFVLKVLYSPGDKKWFRISDFRVETDKHTCCKIIDELDASLVEVPVSLVVLQEIPVALSEMFLQGAFLHIGEYSLARNLAALFFHLWDVGELASRTNRNIFIVAKTEWSTPQFPIKKKLKMFLEIWFDLIDWR